MADILLIEPDTILGETYASALRSTGHEVALHHQAETGIFAVDEKKPDLILLELQLPGHGGVEFLHELRSYTEWQQIPVLLHTMIAPKRIRHYIGRLQSLGVIDYLYKPAASLQQMMKAVDKALRAA